MNRFARRILGVEEVSIDPHGRVLTGGRSPALLSASQAWLLGVAVMAAIAVRAKAPVLVLDGADILVDQNKVALIRWLMIPKYVRILRIPVPSFSTGSGR